ncbi:katanin p60 ATPase-containing subunit A1-like [Arapaima gigas]
MTLSARLQTSTGLLVLKGGRVCVGLLAVFFMVFPVRMSLHEISENVKLAREYALLGNYTSAMACYQGVLEQIKKYVFSVRDVTLQQKWQQVWQEIGQESKNVKEIMSTLESFQLESTPSKPSSQDGDLWPVQVERRSSPCPVRRPTPVTSRDGKPVNNRLSAAARPPHRQSPRGANGERGKGLKSKEKKEMGKNKSDVSETEVKKFDGTGYDKDLVEALERDIISQNPNVKW